MNRELQTKHQFLRIGLLAVSILLTALVVSSCQGPTGSPGDDARISDSLPPTIEWISPDAGSTVSSTVVFSAKAHDDQEIYRVTFFIAGFEFPGTLVDTVQGIYNYNWDASHYPVAPYPIVAMVWDVSRQLGSTPQRIITVHR